MEYYLVYKTTNLINGRYYIGVHKTKNLNDGYLGSGKILLQAVEKNGKENFYREVLKFCKDYTEALTLERELVSEAVLSDPKCYNLCIGGGMPPVLSGDKNPNYGKKLEWASIRMTTNNPSTGKFGEASASFNKVSVVDSEGNTFQIDKSDPRYTDGTVKHVNKGKITVRDKDGNVFHTTKDDPRYISGELVHTTKGLVLTCPYCNKTGGNTMKRWHFENCKFKSLNTLEAA